ncbi:MAG: 4Fe-4S dicluster domain-containing protein, partial [Deltaproteobacteria bacterium]|nr:4Fe-4S dicluster domain-containing protein [Deltaproteobacteria bacterium]
MMEIVRPRPELRETIMGLGETDINLCYTCSSCVCECPVNIATNRLSPRSIVWMANLGLLDELVSLPEIWYCLGCNRCSQICPMTVKPANLISSLQWEARCRQIVSEETFRKYKTLCFELHRIRWRLASNCLQDRNFVLNGVRWQELFEAPVNTAEEAVSFEALAADSKEFKEAADNYLGDPTNASVCFTCGGCSSVCPVFYDRKIFDPLRILRMANLSMKGDILDSPSIWLCLACEKCTNACTQRVRGHLIIRRLQEMALEQGFVDNEFPRRWKEVQIALYARFVEKIDSLFNFNQ